MKNKLTSWIFASSLLLYAIAIMVDPANDLLKVLTHGIGN